MANLLPIIAGGSVSIFTATWTSRTRNQESTGHKWRWQCDFEVQLTQTINMFYTRILTECGPLENGMANHFSILALRTP